jgi:hypothetical protein
MRRMRGIKRPKIGEAQAPEALTMAGEFPSLY